MRRTIDKYPGIRRAMIAIAYDNGMVGNPALGGQTEEQVLDDTEEHMDDPMMLYELTMIDQFLQTLTEEEMELVCAGEQTEAAEFLLSRQAPARTSMLLNDLFDKDPAEPSWNLRPTL